VGFKRTRHTQTASKFSRGSIFGDISIDYAKVNVGLVRINDSEYKLTVEAAWVAAFDTGGIWKFVSELTSKFENA
jgi:hypothetical protein